MSQVDDPKNTPTGGEHQEPVIKEENTDGKGSNPDNPKTFTQEDVDKIVGERLARETDKFTKLMDEKLKKAQEEATRLATLNAEEREKELQKQKENDLAQKEQNLTIRENRANAVEKFAGLGLPLNLIDFVVDANADTMNTRIDALKKSFDEAVQKGIEAQLKGKTPTDPKSNPNQDKKNENMEFAPKNFI